MKTSALALLPLGATAQLTLFAQSTQLPPPSQMKTLGLIGGTSWYSTVDYYRAINQAVNDAYGDSTNPVGLIGTRYTMESGFIGDWLEEHYGIETLVPDSSPARHELQRIIEQELQRGILKAESKKYVLQQIEQLQKRGAQGIVLGCTEFPLIIKPDDVTLPVFDSTLLHSQMAADFILGKHDLARVRAPQ